MCSPPLAPPECAPRMASILVSAPELCPKWMRHTSAQTKPCGLGVDACIAAACIAAACIVGRRLTTCWPSRGCAVKRSMRSIPQWARGRGERLRPPQVLHASWKCQWVQYQIARWPCASSRRLESEGAWTPSNWCFQRVLLPRIADHQAHHH